MPAEAVLSPLGVEWRSWLPTALRDSPDHLAVLHSVAREVERLEGAVEQVRAQFFPQTADVLLKVYEAQLGITVEPVGQTLADRRATVMAMLRKQRATPAGTDWQENVTRLVGTGWSYQEHDPANAASPPPYTVRVQLPFEPASSNYAQVERLLRDITPAHLDLVVTYSGGFQLDRSQLDQEAVS